MQVRMDERPGAAVFHRVVSCDTIGVANMAISLIEGV
jgi:hypothetical protein